MKKTISQTEYIKQLEVEISKLKLELKNLKIDYILLHNKCASLKREICCLLNAKSLSFNLKDT